MTAILVSPIEGYFDERYVHPDPDHTDPLLSVPRNYMQRQMAAERLDDLIRRKPGLREIESGALLCCLRDAVMSA